MINLKNLSVLSLFFILLPQSTFAAGKEVGTVRAVINDVSIVSHKGAVKSAKVGDPVRIKDTISTGTDGRIKILFDNDNILVLGFQTRITVDELVYDPKSKDSKSMFGLLGGKIRAVVKGLFTPGSHFKIKTANSDIGVLGTDFVVIYDEHTNELQAFVESGQISISSPKKLWEDLRLLESYSTTIGRGAPPATPFEFSKETFAPVKNELTIYEDASLSPRRDFDEFVSGERGLSDPIDIEPMEPSVELPIVPPIDQEPQTGTVRVKVTTPFP